MDVSKQDNAFRPYFLWDDDLTLEQLRVILGNPNHPKFAYYLGKTLREANYRDVWELVSLKFLAMHFAEVNPYLGKQRKFWEFLFSEWTKMGLLPH